MGAPKSAWHLSPRDPRVNASFGCEYAGGRWQVAKYTEHPKGGDAAADVLAMSELSANGEVVSVPKWAAATALARLATEGLTMEVRSRADPFFRALELTDGSLNFGMA